MDGVSFLSKVCFPQFTALNLETGTTRFSSLQHLQLHHQHSPCSHSDGKFSTLLTPLHVALAVFV